MMFAEIAVNRAVSTTFHYHIPDHLAGRIAPGHLVKISFGTAHTTGIVMDLHDNSPIAITKPILELLDPLPVVTPAQLALARWLAAETISTIGACLWLMLPPGLAKRGDFLYTLLDETSDDLTPTQHRLVSLLQRRGPLRARQLSNALPQTRWQAPMSGLVKRELVRQEPVLDPPDVKPKIVRTARLAIPAERIPAIAPRLGRESRRANVLEVLLAARDHQVQLGALMAAAGCTAGPVKALGDSGLITLEPIVFPPGPDAADPPRKKRIPKAQALAARLLCTREEAQQRIIALRGGGIYLDVLDLLAAAGDEVEVSEIYRQTGTTLNQLRRLDEDELIVLGEAESWRDPLIDSDFIPTAPPPLTSDQAHVWSEIRDYMDTVHWGDISPSPDVSGVFLLHGVTGSGKTEIYLRAVERALAQGRQAIVLVPEISLTPQTVRRFAARFPGRVAIVHSSLTQGERYDTWRRARRGEIHIVVGARSALFTPLPDVGLVILDEEHDDSYKQSPPILPPFYHARETAIQLMKITHGTVLLGSATPDVVTYFRAERGDYRLLRLPDRIIAHRERIAEQTRRLNAPAARYHPTDAADAVSAELPLVHVVDMRQELKTGNRSIFSHRLRTALNEALARGEQAILFLNRRGTATFVMCRNCGYIALCPRCSTPLTYHGPRESLICHYCGHTQPHITTCPDCGSTRIKHFGQGTELIESAVNAEFPSARTIRWDRDTATGRDAHTVILHTFSERKADILIGTQMVAKGLDLPQVTLVGIISADTALGLPDFRSGERTFQLLTQVAGRAGRGALGGSVVLQTYLPEHYAIQAAAHHDFETFYRQEIAYRRDQRYPPYKSLARITFQSPTAEQTEAEAQRAKAIIEQQIAEGHFTATDIIGPTPCFFARRNALYRWHLIIRSVNPTALLARVDVGANWFVDIHPVDML